MHLWIDAPRSALPFPDAHTMSTNQPRARLETLAHLSVFLAGFHYPLRREEELARYLQPFLLVQNCSANAIIANALITSMPSGGIPTRDSACKRRSDKETKKKRDGYTTASISTRPTERRFQWPSW